MQQAFFRRNNNRPGQYLVEVLVSLGVFMIVIGALAAIHIDAQKIQHDATLRMKAEQYAQEGIAAVSSLRTSAWAKLTPGTHGLSSASGTWLLTEASDTKEGLTREIAIAFEKRNASGDIDPSGTVDAFGKTVSVTIKRTSDLTTIVQQSMYLTYPEGKQWRQTTQADFATGTHSSTTAGSTGDGSVTLSQSGTVASGFPFIILSTPTDLKLSSAAAKVSFRIQPTVTQPIAEIRVYVSAQANPPTFRIGLQGSNASGVPTGTWLGPTARGYGLFRPTTTGWQTISLTENVTLAPGQIVHVVTQYESGTISNTRSITLQATTPTNPIFPPNGASDSQSQTYFTTTGTWTVKNYEPIVVVRSTTNEYFGNPYTSTTITRVYDTTLAGQRFVVGSSPLTVAGIGMYVSRTGTPLDNLRLSVRNLATNTVLTQGILATPSIGTTLSWRTITFSSPITLQADTAYRFELSSTGSTTPSRRYNIATISSDTSSNYPSLTYQQTQGFLETKAGAASWTSATQTDIPFQMSIQNGYASSGTFLSPAFDTGLATTSFATFIWNGVIPSSTALSFQIRTASTQAGLTTATWVGPDGTAGSTFASFDTITIASGATGTRWIQYRAQFSSTNTSLTPELDDVTILYGP